MRALKLGIAPVLNQIDADLEQRAVLANVRHNVEQLTRAKPILATMISRNDVRAVGGAYDLATDNATWCRDTSKTGWLGWNVTKSPGRLRCSLLH